MHGTRERLDIQQQTRRRLVASLSRETGERDNQDLACGAGPGRREEPRGRPRKGADPSRPERSALAEDAAHEDVCGLSVTRGQRRVTREPVDQRADVVDLGGPPTA